MAKKRSPHQERMIRNYYKNRDAIALQNLQELVTELYLVPDEFKFRRLWQRVEKALQNLGVDEAEVARLVKARDVKDLAKFIGGKF